MHLFLSYCKSHIYELHALLSATITFFLMFEIKKPIKEWTHKYVAEKAQKDKKWRENRQLYYKRCNMLVFIAAINAEREIRSLLVIVVSSVRFLLDFQSEISVNSVRSPVSAWRNSISVFGSR